MAARGQLQGDRRRLGLSLGGGHGDRRRIAPNQPHRRCLLHLRGTLLAAAFQLVAKIRWIFIAHRRV